MKKYIISFLIIFTLHGMDPNTDPNLDELMFDRRGNIRRSVSVGSSEEASTLNTRPVPPPRQDLGPQSSSQPSKSTQNAGNSKSGLSASSMGLPSLWRQSVMILSGKGTAETTNAEAEAEIKRLIDPLDGIIRKINESSSVMDIDRLFKYVIDFLEKLNKYSKDGHAINLERLCPILMKLDNKKLTKAQSSKFDSLRIEVGCISDADKEKRIIGVITALPPYITQKFNSSNDQEKATIFARILDLLKSIRAFKDKVTPDQKEQLKDIFHKLDITLLSEQQKDELSRVLSTFGISPISAKYLPQEPLSSYDVQPLNTTMFQPSSYIDLHGNRIEPNPVRAAKIIYNKQTIPGDRVSIIIENETEKTANCNIRLIYGAYAGEIVAYKPQSIDLFVRIPNKVETFLLPPNTSFFIDQFGLAQPGQFQIKLLPEDISEDESRTESGQPKNKSPRSPRTRPITIDFPGKGIFCNVVIRITHINTTVEMNMQQIYTELGKPGPAITAENRYLFKPDLSSIGSK